MAAAGNVITVISLVTAAGNVINFAIQTLYVDTHKIIYLLPPKIEMVPATETAVATYLFPATETAVATYLFQEQIHANMCNQYYPLDIGYNIYCILYIISI